MGGQLISVVMAAHDEEDRIGAAIDSVLNQSHEELELVVVDDGSKDRTRERIESFADPRIRLLVNDTNRGLPRSLNRAIAASNGEYVARMDADDRCQPFRLARQIERLHRDQDAQVVGCWYRVIGAKGEYFGDIRRSDRGEVGLEEIIRDGPGIAHGSVMMRREALEALDGYREAFTYSQDLDLWLRMAETYGPGFLRIVEETLYDQRITPNSYRKQPKQRLFGTIAKNEFTSNRSKGIRVPLRFMREIVESDEYVLSAADARSRYHEKAGQWLIRRRRRNDGRRRFLKSLLASPTNVKSWYGLMSSLRP